MKKGKKFPKEENNVPSTIRSSYICFTKPCTCTTTTTIHVTTCHTSQVNKFYNGITLHEHKMSMKSKNFHNLNIQ
jgi:hypothetical protein